MDVISPQQGKVKGWKHTDWGEEVSVDRQLDGASADEYDALLLPGGVMRGIDGRVVTALPHDTLKSLLKKYGR